ncbi:tetratricopeptide repeat protein [Riemerella columbipharyngis]|uniref:Tetratricopeptide repeat-containing protein n=1 Tax=Riemerella columbipharyngis TaxID=1071918 RepID=A0A1G7ETR9_9FLAO|nr:tetratricopeptide repeat protein [Riemerella columbipharyngis]SDE66886.1 hypothetical protein SAMN05421544_11732 [Riemerella columbipharyngis]
MKKKLFLGSIGVLFFASLGAQTVEEGLSYADAHKYTKAKEVFNQLVQKSPSSENYFYLGNVYITQNYPDLDKAKSYFQKGAEADKKPYLDMIGLASVKLGKGDKSGLTDIQEIVQKSRGKDAEVLFRAGEALTLFPENNNPDLAIQYINQAIERAKDKEGKVPDYYYYSLGDAYRLKKKAGDAMTAYDNAAMVAKNKASVYTRMATLWMAASQWKLAMENMQKAVSVDPTYAPVYQALANYHIIYQKHDEAAADLLNYLKYADEDPQTLLSVAKLYFANGNYQESNQILDKVFDKVDDSIKYKLKAYILYNEGKYDEAKQNIDIFVSKASADRVLSADQGLVGLIYAAQAQKAQDQSVKNQMMQQALQKINIAKAAKDTTLNWDEELAKVSGANMDSDEGPTNPAIEALKKQIAADPKNSDNLYKLAIAYQEAKNWNGAASTWQKMIVLLPTWAPAYYSQGYAYQQAKKDDFAKMAYQKYIDMMSTQPQDEQDKNKDMISYAYFVVAYYERDTDRVKAKDYVIKSLQINPDYSEAQNLLKYINANIDTGDAQQGTAK